MDVHFYSASSLVAAQSTLQHLTHTYIHRWWSLPHAGFIRSNLGFGILLKDTSTGSPWELGFEPATFQLTGRPALPPWTLLTETHMWWRQNVLQFNSKLKASVHCNNKLHRDFSIYKLPRVFISDNRYGQCQYILSDNESSRPIHRPRIKKVRLFIYILGLYCNHSTVFQEELFPEEVVWAALFSCSASSVSIHRSLLNMPLVY